MAAKKKSARKPTAPEARRIALWTKQGRALKVSQHQWAIAEWILRGEEEKIFRTKKALYDRAVELTGMTRESLQSFASVARSVAPLTRVKKLSFGHHRLVMSYSPEKQKELLKAAEGQSVEWFASYIRQRDDDEAELNNGSSAVDHAVDQVLKRVEAFTNFVTGNDSFGTLVDEAPNSHQREKVLRAMKAAVIQLEKKIATLLDEWPEQQKAKTVGA